MSGQVDTPAGTLPRVTSLLSSSDRLGGCKARWGIGRMDYKVDPGLYALNRPDAASPVLVTANYKLTFDALRRDAAGLDAWVLAVDTAGINVWCAAGKGAFGAEGVARAVADSGLARVVSHRTLILPQLAGPGVAAQTVKKQTGFQAAFGPILARDIPAFLDAGMKAAPAMRKKDFPLRERAVLIPMELVAALKWGLLMAAGLLLLGGLGAGGYGDNLARHGAWAAVAVLGAALAGSILGPLLLPWLPGRAFAAKGLGLGLAWGALLLAAGRPGWLEGLGWLGMSLALISFLVMNFTGASTYTSLSGVKKEMRWGVPAQIACGALGLVSWLASRWMS